jgi:hypothetical protein
VAPLEDFVCGAADGAFPEAFSNRRALAASGTLNLALESSSTAVMSGRWGIGLSPCGRMRWE